MEEQPAIPEMPERASPPTPAAGAANPFVYPERTSWVPGTIGATYDANLNPTGPFRLSMPHRNGMGKNGK